MIFKTIQQNISDIYVIGNKINEINKLKLDTTNITRYATTLNGLNTKQAELILSTKGLSAAQQQAILSETVLLGTTGKLTTAELEAILVTKKRNKDQAEALLINTGLITSETAEATATNVVTTTKLKELVQTKALTQAEADLIAAKAGVTLANQKESVSLLAGIGTKIKGAGTALKGLGTGILTIASAHPVITGITAVIALCGGAAIVNKVKHETAAKAIKEAYENAKTAIDDINNTFNENSSKTKEIAKEYAELAQGVNLLTNENKKLSTEKYERFLELSDQLSSLYPSLTKNYDENGVAILSLSGDIDTIVGSLDDLIERQRALANQEIVEQMPDLFKGYSNNVADYEEQVDNAEKTRDKIQKAYEEILKYGIYNAFDLNGNAKDANGDYVALTLGQYIDLLKTLGITAKQVNLKDSMGQVIGYKLELEDGGDIPNISGIYDSYISAFNKAKDDVKYAEQQLNAERSSINQYLNTWLQTEFSYNQLEDSGLQKAVQETLFHFDWNSLPEGIDKNDWEAVSEYLRRNILFSINNINDDKVSKALADVYTDSLNSGELLEAIAKVQEYFGDEHPISVSLQTKINDVEPLINNVKDKLKGTEFDDKVRELSLGDLQIAADLDISDDTIQSWDELIERIEKFKSETFNNETNHLSISQTITQLDTIKSKMDVLDKTYAKLFDDDASTNIGFEDFSSLNAAFKDLDGIDRYIQRLQEAGQNQEAATKIMSDLAGAYINQTGILDNITDQNAALIEQTLTEVGIEEAHELVTRQLAAAKEIAALQSFNLADATFADIQKLIEEKQVSDEAGNYLLTYALKKELANGTTLTTASDIENIKALVLALGGAVNALERFQTVKNGLPVKLSNPNDKKIHTGNNSVYVEGTYDSSPYQEDAQKEIDDILNAPYHFGGGSSTNSTKNYSSNPSSGSSSSPSTPSSTPAETSQTFDCSTISKSRPTPKVKNRFPLTSSLN